MKLQFPALATASLFLLSAGIHAQTYGTSHPEELNDTITTAPPAHNAKPSPAVPMSDAAAPVVAGPASSLHEHATDSTPAPIETAQATAQASGPALGLRVTEDPDSGIVTEVPSAANEIPEGTFVFTRLGGDISTDTTDRGAAFQAEITRPIERGGRIVIPAGAILSGRVSELQSGHHLHGPATIHLQPDFITLPGGIAYKVDAQVTDIGPAQGEHVSNEGTIIGNDHAKGQVAAVGLTTLTGATVGGVVGGGIGAVVGAGVGLGAGTALVLRQDTQQTLPQGMKIVFILNSNMLLEPVAR